jgi:anaerobic selenocysteine-containing dehydrogenase
MESRNSIEDIWGEAHGFYEKWPRRLDQRTSAEPDHWVQSTCVLCSTGCALDIGVKDGRIVGVRGREVDRVNLGRLGPKGLHGWEANHTADRLTHPLVRREGRLQQATWDEAMDLIGARVREIKEKHSANAIGFYNTGQLMLEEYYTLAIIGDVGVGTIHMDGNTRLCTATAAMALIESFGTDGDPGTYDDFNLTDTIFMIGHNMAMTQTVLWMRVRDRLEGPNPPRLVVIDPRATVTAKRATLHLAPRVGTNLALMNGFLHLIVKAGHIDRSFIDEHTMGYETLEETVARYTPEWVEELTSVPVKQLREAAELLGTAPTLVSTVLQGVYQSLQATATAVQVNNLHLIRGMIGRPGATVFQMNGQPSAENTRECGANGELVAMRNYENPDHVADQARLWNVTVDQIPHYKPPTHAMQIFRYAEMGSIRLLWILGTNPAVSLPELERIRHILQKESLFVVVNDAWLTETAALADVVLPAAIWGEKTGCMTNADRTVHILNKAVEPPGEARSDFDILVDFARRMNYRDKDGQPLIKWTEPEQAFEHWKQTSKERPCDYSGLTYARLREGSGLQWPVTAEAPNGTARLYTDGVFNTDASYCETYGHDLVTGAAITPEQYKANNPAGRAIIKAADHIDPPEKPDDDYPLLLTTGRVVYHWHTRTKTGRTPELQAAAPEAFVQLSREDATREGIVAGDMVEVTSRRGSMRAPARVGDIAPGMAFIPFHYGYWDEDDHRRAANELTLTGWDPVSKQPHFKYAAVRVRKVE